MNIAALPALVSFLALAPAQEGAAPVSAPSDLVVPVKALQFEGEEPNWSGSGWLRSGVAATLVPRAVVEGYAATLAVEGFRGDRLQFTGIRGGDLALEGPEPAGDLEGVLFLPNFGATAYERFEFTVPAAAIERDELSFRIAQASRYWALAASGVPGTPWFRRRAQAFGDGIDDLPVRPDRVERSRNDTFAMFTGGRALAENLALDDVVEGASDGESASVEIGTIDGVRVPGMVWGPLVEGLDPKLDALSSAIPFDQHAVFFPSFAAMVEVGERIEAEAAPLVHFFDGRAESAGVRGAYERQMCLKLDAFTRQLGGTLVKSVAITGSDPYLRTGSDVAVLLEGDPAKLLPFLTARVEAAAARAGVEVERYELAGSAVVGAQTRDRTLCAHIASAEGFAVVANSAQLLERVLSTASGEIESLAQLDEFRWFRDRYELGATNEDALVMVSDATIRRWSSPRWRIASSRRTKAAAVLADAEAFRLAGARGLLNAAAPVDVSPVMGGGALETSGAHALDSTYGRLSFLTPIAELDLGLVTPDEQAGYERWRRGYEAAWGTSFDPLCVRLDVRPDGVDVDLTLVPLMVRSDYRDLIGLAGDTLLKGIDGRAHAGTLLHWVCAIDKEGETFRRWARMLDGVPGMKADWLGDHMSIWVDYDEDYLQRVREADSFDMFTEEMLPELPVGVLIDVDSPLGLAAFLTGLRSQVEGSVPDLLQFQTSEYKGRQFVEIVVSDGAGFEETPVIRYVVVPGGVVFSLSEKLIHGVIERVLSEELALGPWEGQSTALSVGSGFQDAAAIEMIDLAVREQLRARCWGNLPILNEWRDAGIEDPVAFHEAEWGLRLVCPGGGEYVWNEADRTMESTAYGHPGAPKEGPELPPGILALTSIDLGLQFEPMSANAPDGRDGERVQSETSTRGLRATISLRR